MNEPREIVIKLISDEPDVTKTINAAKFPSDHTEIETFLNKASAGPNEKGTIRQSTDELEQISNALLGVMPMGSSLNILKKLNPATPVSKLLKLLTKKKPQIDDVASIVKTNSEIQRYLANIAKIKTMKPKPNSYYKKIIRDNPRVYSSFKTKDAIASLKIKDELIKKVAIKNIKNKIIDLKRNPIKVMKETEKEWFIPGGAEFIKRKDTGFTGQLDIPVKKSKMPSLNKLLDELLKTPTKTKSIKSTSKKYGGSSKGLAERYLKNQRGFVILTDDEDD